VIGRGETRIRYRLVFDKKRSDPLAANKLFERAPIVTRNAGNSVTGQREATATIGKRSTEPGLMIDPSGSPETTRSEGKYFVSFRVS
jgi:competence transcription factor ComK